MLKLNGKNLIYTKLIWLILTFGKDREEPKVVSILFELAPLYASAKNWLLIATEAPNMNAAFSRLSRIPLKLILLLRLFEVLS